MSSNCCDDRAANWRSAPRPARPTQRAVSRRRLRYRRSDLRKVCRIQSFSNAGAAGSGPNGRGLPAVRPIRILEVGGGTGGTASYVAQMLPAGLASSTYLVIFRRCSSCAAPTNSVNILSSATRYSTSSATRSPGFCGADIRHRDRSQLPSRHRDLRVSLAHVTRLLAPDGMLVMLESTCRNDGWISPSA